VDRRWPKPTDYFSAVASPRVMFGVRPPDGNGGLRRLAHRVPVAHDVHADRAEEADGERDRARGDQRGMDAERRAERAENQLTGGRQR